MTDFVLERSLETRTPTPCIGVCSTVFGDQVCRGCKRFSHEVIAWNAYSEAEKRAVEARLQMLLGQIVQGKVRIVSQARLSAIILEYKIPVARHRDMYCQLYDLLRHAANQVTVLSDFGVVALPEAAHMTAVDLRNAIENEFLLLSEAHHQRFFDG